MNQYTAAVIGLGQIGLTYDFDSKREKPSAHSLAYHLHGRVALTAAVDVREEQKEALRKIAPEAKFYQSVDEFVQYHAVDIISICTPPAYHLPLINFILEKSQPKIIFCEKPLVDSVKEANLLKSKLQNAHCLIVPNFSRRWNSGMQRIKEQIIAKNYGELLKVHVRYTRGIFNTGAHLFDLIHWWAGQINMVQVLQKVSTTADKGDDPSFTFVFQIGESIAGFVEAFDDSQYYMFEIDLYFTKGKVEIRNSGNDVFYHRIGDHHLFSGFSSLQLERHEGELLKEANLGKAVNNLINVLDGHEQPECTYVEGIYPLYVADTLLRSYHNHCSKERVDIK